jgi:tetratricopeptide (TPR) repeat protein
MRRSAAVAHGLLLVALTGCASGGGASRTSGAGRPAAAPSSCTESPEIAAGAEAARRAAREGQYEDALRLAEEVLRSCPDQPVASAALGQALVGLGRLEEAIARLTSVLQARPDLAYAYYWRGKAYNGRQLTARMVDDFEAFLRLAPDAPEAAAIRQLLSSLR